MSPSHRPLVTTLLTGGAAIALVAGTAAAAGASAPPSDAIAWGGLHPTAVATPAPLSGVTGVVQVASGGDGTAFSEHGAAVTQGGQVLTWGYNVDGALGNGAGPSTATPAIVAGISDVTSVAVGERFVLALRSDGTVWGWGDNSAGNLATGDNTSTKVPVQSVLSGVAAIAAGRNHALALLQDGTVVAWGANASGQLGTGTFNSPTPLPVPLTGTIVGVAAGSAHSVALTDAGAVWAWGNNINGELGNLSAGLFGGPTPVPVLDVAGSGAITGVTAISARGFHTLALRQNGTLVGWGQNNAGELGNGTTNQASRPVAVTGLTNVVGVDIGSNHAVALTADGKVWAWGHRGQGQVGDGSFTGQQLTPRELGLADQVVAVAAGASASFALVDSGPEPVVPEVPLTVLLPLTGAAVLGVAGLARSRRSAAV